MFRQITPIALAAAALAAMGTSAAFATTITEHGSLSSQTTTAYNAPGLTIYIPQFDTTLGTLNSISISTTTSEVANVSVNNTDLNNAWSFTNGKAEVFLNVTGPSSFSQYVTTDAIQPSGTVAANSTQNYPGLTGSQTSSNTVTTGLSSFEGVGSNNLSFAATVLSSSFSGTTSAPSNTLYFGGGSSLGVDLTVVYDYTATSVPEPTTLALMGTAIIGIGLVRRKRAS